jgi:hypothetical protein
VVRRRLIPGLFGGGRIGIRPSLAVFATRDYALGTLHIRAPTVACRLEYGCNPIPLFVRPKMPPPKKLQNPCLRKPEGFRFPRSQALSFSIDPGGYWDGAPPDVTAFNAVISPGQQGDRYITLDSNQIFSGHDNNTIIGKDKINVDISNDTAIFYSALGNVMTLGAFGVSNKVVHNIAHYGNDTLNGNDVLNGSRRQIFAGSQALSFSIDPGGYWDGAPPDVTAFNAVISPGQQGDRYITLDSNQIFSGHDNNTIIGKDKINNTSHSTNQKQSPRFFYRARLPSLNTCDARLLASK